MGQLMANPNLVEATLRGADATQAAALLKRVIDRVMAANLNASQRTYLIAYYTARITFLVPAGERNAFASELIPQVPPEHMTAVLAGFSLGGRGSMDFISHVQEIIQDNEAYVQALRTPRASMSNPIYDQLVISLAASHSLPPTIVDSLPPPIPVGPAAGEPVRSRSQPAPPVAETYQGQG